MADSKTRERILETAVEMWSAQSYNAVSIRDIAHAVNIRESSIYYHFKSKKDILDTIIAMFEEKAAATADSLITSISESILLQSAKKTGLFHRKSADINAHAFLWLKTYYCEQFLFDPFTNSVMRILMLEQFHDEAIAAKYEEWLFNRPRTLMMQALRVLEITDDASDDTYAEPFGSFLTGRIFHYLLTGKLTEEKCRMFSGELEAFVSAMFGAEAVREVTT